MEEFIDIFLKNPFVIILLIGGIISLLRRKSDSSSEQEQPKESFPTQQQADTIRDRAESMRNKKVDKQPEAVSPVSIEEQRKKQIQHLGYDQSAEDHIALTDHENNADERRDDEIHHLSSSLEHKPLKRRFKGNLTRKGLVDSIVMSEVLGPPRSRSAYRSVVKKRIES